MFVGDLGPTGNSTPSPVILSNTATDAQDDDSDIGMSLVEKNQIYNSATTRMRLKGYLLANHCHLVEAERCEGGDEGEGGASPPDTFSANVKSRILTSPRLSSAGPIDSTASSQKVYVLVYDAAIWGHDETSDKITLLDGATHYHLCR